ncbi:MAG: DUF2303 family protein [Sulfuriferula sp.]
MSTETVSNTEAEAIANIAAKPIMMEVQGTPIVFSPINMVSRTLAELLPTPTRKSGRVHLHESDSFIDYVKRHGSLASCNIYLDVDYAKQHVKATAVFNDHADGDGLPGWRDHRAEFMPRFTEEWSRWSKNNVLPKSQTDFATFLETNIGDITSPENSKMPSGADVLTFVSQLQETRKVKYGSAINLANGMMQIEFIEEGDAATKGKLDIFREFSVGIRPFLNGQAYEVRAFLRYRIDRNNGAIMFWYELQRAERVLEDACKGIVKSIRTETGMPVVFGTPE